MPALLDQRRVVHDQHGIGTTDQAVGLLGQHPLQPVVRPGRGGDEVVQLLDLARADAGRHRLHALALAGQQQALHIQRRPAPLLRPRQCRQERRKPGVQLRNPGLSLAIRHRRPATRHTRLTIWQRTTWQSSAREHCGMPNGSWKGRSVMFVGAILSLSACNGFGDVTETLNPSGPASLSSKGYAVTDLPLNPGQMAFLS